MDAVVVVESTEEVVELVGVEAVVVEVVVLVLTGPGKYVVVFQDQVVRSVQVLHQGHQVVLEVSVTASLHHEDSALAFTFFRYSMLYPT